MNRMGFLGDLLAQLLDRRSVPLLAPADRPMGELCRALLSGRGEVSGMRLAREILTLYRGMDATERRAFFSMLADEFDVDAKAVSEAATAYGTTRDAKALERLIRHAEPRRQEILRRLNHAPGATAELVRMRLDLLRLIPEAPDLARVDLDFAHLLSSWFNRGFLVLHQVTWDSPAKLLEKIIAYEAVHEIDDWEALRGRTDPPDRRCFAFFHPAMPDEPLIFVEVALVKGLPGSVQELLTPGRAVLDPADADTATFYSISNCQEGLRGISFGNSLIKQVVEVLRQEFPHLKTFVTLSPIPGLARWMARQAAAGDAQCAALLERLPRQEGRFDEADALALRQQAAYYLLEARRGDGKPLDPVARFHLGNGAQVHEVHAGADLSRRGLKQSCGAMVNYLYDGASIEANHEAYAGQGTVAAARALRGLARAVVPPSLPTSDKTLKEANANGEPAA